MDTNIDDDRPAQDELAEDMPVKEMDEQDVALEDAFSKRTSILLEIEDKEEELAELKQKLADTDKEVNDAFGFEVNLNG